MSVTLCPIGKHRLDARSRCLDCDTYVVPPKCAIGDHVLGTDLRCTRCHASAQSIMATSLVAIRVGDTASSRRSFTTCGPWRAALPQPSGRVRHSECMAHGSRGPGCVDLRYDRCAVARRSLPRAR